MPSSANMANSAAKYRPTSASIASLLGPVLANVPCLPSADICSSTSDVASAPSALILSSISVCSALPYAIPPSERQRLLSTWLSSACDTAEPRPASSSRLSDAHARIASEPAAVARTATTANMSCAASRCSPAASHASADERSRSTPMPVAPCLRTSPFS